jgi:hypothetical protein
MGGTQRYQEEAAGRPEYCDRQICLFWRGFHRSKRLTLGRVVQGPRHRLAQAGCRHLSQCFAGQSILLACAPSHAHFSGAAHVACLASFLENAWHRLSEAVSLRQDVAKQRGGYGQERYETEEFQEKVGQLLQSVLGATATTQRMIFTDCQCMLWQVREHFDTLRCDDGDLWELVDANRSQDEVAEMIAEIAIRKAAQVTSNFFTPIGMPCRRCPFPPPGTACPRATCGKLMRI